MTRRILAFALTLALAAPAAAQEAMHEHHAGGLDAVKPLYETVKGYLMKSAEQMSEADYAFQPTPDVRTFGQLLGHIANAQYLFCSTALNEKSPSTADAEKLATKAEMMKALKDSFAYCDKAYAISERDAMAEATVFGRKANRLFALNFNMGHNFEHYGNIVTYMRMKGMVPPSSQRSGM